MRAPALALAAALAWPGALQAVDVRAPGASYTLRVTSLKEARFRTTVPQRFDFSCGSAATATLLTYQYGQPVSEADVFREMFANASGISTVIQNTGANVLIQNAMIVNVKFADSGP